MLFGEARSREQSAAAERGTGRGNRRVRELLAAALRVLRTQRLPESEDAAMNHAYRTVLALTLWIVLVPASYADVVELKTGPRVQGTLKQATPAGVVIEVGGETITIEPEKVRAIYFESPPSGPSQPSVRDEAMQALKGLHAATRGGITYTEYARQFTAAKSVVDRYLQEPTEPGSREVRAAMAEAMRYYGLASAAWNARVARGDYSMAGADPIIEKCPELKRVVDEAYAERAKTPSYVRSTPTSALTAYDDGRAVAAHLPVVWSCAANKIVEAERLMP